MIMKITVIGAGKSGIAATLLAKRKGNDVFLTEKKPADEFQEAIGILQKENIDFEFGSHTSDSINNTDLIVTSPGVPSGNEIITLAEKKGIRIISELEFAYNFLDNPIIAITGTNGKTTTTTLTTFILNHSGKKAVSAGNIGTPLSSLVDNVDKNTVIVVEASSFQLDRIENFKPHVAMILNISPDHLYYHNSMENYISAKWKIFLNQNQKDLLILNADDNELKKAAKQSRGKIAWFSLNPVDYGVYAKHDKMIARLSDNEEVIMLLDEIRIPGIHNAYNSMAAVLAARAFEIRNENIRDSLMAFQGVEHRLEFVRTIDDVDYINDSKATNVNATWYALSSYKEPIIWIAGGRGDSNDYSLLDDVVIKNVKCIICIGEESDNIFNHFSSKKRCFKEPNLVNAVIRAKEQAKAGDVVLFTPACKSFDMFINYEHRGEVFKEIVKEL